MTCWLSKCAALAAVHVELVGIAKVYLDLRHMTVSIASYPAYVLGRPDMKSMLMEWKFSVGIASGFNKP